MEASQASLQALTRPEHPGDVEAYIVARVPALLRLGYQPETDGQTYAALLREHVGALYEFPIWALAEAMDKWVAQHSRRPAPAELRILAQRAIAPITDEIAERRKQAEAAAVDDEERYRNRCSPKAAAHILRDHGFTPDRLAAVASGQFNRAARSLSDLDAPASGAAKAAHWSDTAAPDDPRWETLKASRARGTKK